MSEENEVNEDEITEGIEEELSKEKKIRVEHVFEDRRGMSGDEIENTEKIKKLEKKLQEREAQLSALALAEFEKEKAKVMELVPNEKKGQVEAFIGDDPDKLEIAKFQYGISDEDDDGTEKVPPKGKVRQLIRKPKSEGDARTAIIGELYKIRGEKALTPDDVAKQNVAEQKTDQLFEQMEQGLLDRPKGQGYAFEVAQCSKCNTVLFGRDAKMWAEKGICNACGYRPKRRQ